jgi:hypothetical protein
MIKFPNSSFLLFLIVCAHFWAASCSSTPADPKKGIRMDWKNYFNAYLDFRGKESKMGTDSTKIVFENNSDYLVDSATLIFENQGLLVHHFDTVTVKNIPSKTPKSVTAPSHKLGWKHKVEIFAIYSKALQFRYRGDLPKEKQQGDCYFCK